ncbi:hypothetical protein ZHAS_00018192 [Anopheles sinensis]|uniref:Fibrinogen C-terminal domain-containing protein n=1 Tax=Anopheles sinensis TaxID=74873 RepID=A0A084WHK6_ANOSI|nr:hypothetical protein ZHAS_00018192 [Anopheles sinensis]
MKILVCVVFLFYNVLLYTGSSSASDISCVNLTFSNVIVRLDNEHGVPCSDLSNNQAGNTPKRIDHRSITEVEISMKQRYKILEEKLIEIERQLKAKDESVQQLFERSIKERYDSVQSKLEELENNFKEFKKLSTTTDEALKKELVEFKKSAKTKDETLQEAVRNMSILEDNSRVHFDQLQTNLTELQAVTKNIIALQLESGKIPRSCKEISKEKSGKYVVHFGIRMIKSVYCEQQVQNGGWIVFQHRFNGEVDFNRSWAEYRDGFGSIDGEFWMGLKYLHKITSSRKYELLVEIRDYSGNYGYANYDHFEIGSEAEQFTLKVGKYSGTAGDAMTFNHDTKFATADHKDSNFKAAKYYEGAWWFGRASYTNLNGPYKNATGIHQTMYWYDFHGDLRGMAFTRMMLREID